MSLNRRRCVISAGQIPRYTIMVVDESEGRTKIGRAHVSTIYPDVFMNEKRTHSLCRTQSWHSADSLFSDVSTKSCHRTYRLHSALDRARKTTRTGLDLRRPTKDKAIDQPYIAFNRAPHHVSTALYPACCSYSLSLSP